MGDIALCLGSLDPKLPGQCKLEVYSYEDKYGLELANAMTK